MKKNKQGNYGIPACYTLPRALQACVKLITAWNKDDHTVLHLHAVEMICDSQGILLHC